MQSKQPHNHTPKAVASDATDPLSRDGATAQPAPASDRLLQDLQLHQVELKTQIEQLRTAKSELEESRRRYADLYELAPVGFLTIDTQGQISEVNLTAAELFGVERDDLLNHRFEGFLTPDDGKRWTRLYAGLQRHTDRQSIELAFRPGLGPMLHGRLDCLSIIPPEGDVQVRIALTDITKRKLAEQALSESEATYRGIIDSCKDGFWMIDREGHILAANDAYLHCSGYGRDELLAMRISDVDTLEDDAAVAAHLAKVKAEGSHLFETCHRAKDGTIWPVEVMAAYWPEAGGRTFAFLRDISERNRMLDALRTSEALYHVTFDHAAIGIAHVALDGRYLRVNRKLCDLLGYREEELKQIRFLDITYQEDREKDRTRLQQLLSGELRVGRFEKRYVRKDGAIIWANLTVACVEKADGSPDYMISTVDDISARKEAEAELQLLQQDRERLTRLQVASQTASALAHELNQPLNALTSFTSAALRMLTGEWQPDKLRYALQQSAQQAQRAGQVIQDLINFLHQGEVKRSSLDLNELVLGVCQQVKVNHFSKVQLKVVQMPRMPAVSANRLQIEKVLTNLIDNGIEAMCHAGIVESDIEVTVKTNFDGDMAQVTVRDKGPGIDRQALHQIFGPFFSTKPQGLGMGLAISRSIIEAHGGQLWAESQPGIGATFHFTLPFAP